MTQKPIVSFRLKETPKRQAVGSNPAKCAICSAESPRNRGAFGAFFLAHGSDWQRRYAHPRRKFANMSMQGPPLPSLAKSSPQTGRQCSAGARTPVFPCPCRKPVVFQAGNPQGTTFASAGSIRSRRTGRHGRKKSALCRAFAGRQRASRLFRQGGFVQPPGLTACRSARRFPDCGYNGA